MDATLIEVGTADFDVVALYIWLSASNTNDEVVIFTGKVHNNHLRADVGTLTMEYYPDMPEKNAGGNRGAGARVGR